MRLYSVGISARRASAYRGWARVTVVRRLSCRTWIRPAVSSPASSSRSTTSSASDRGRNSQTASDSSTCRAGPQAEFIHARINSSSCGVVGIAPGSSPQISPLFTSAPDLDAPWTSSRRYSTLPAEAALRNTVVRRLTGPERTDRSSTPTCSSSKGERSMRKVASTSAS